MGRRLSLLSATCIRRIPGCLAIASPRGFVCSAERRFGETWHCLQSEGHLILFTDHITNSVIVDGGRGLLMSDRKTSPPGINPHRRIACSPRPHAGTGRNGRRFISPSRRVIHRDEAPVDQSRKVFSFASHFGQAEGAARLAIVGKMRQRGKRVTESDVEACSSVPRMVCPRFVGSARLTLRAGNLRRHCCAVSRVRALTIKACPHISENY